RLAGAGLGHDDGFQADRLTLAQGHDTLRLDWHTCRPTMPSMSAEELRRVARESFGWERLRDEQLQAMEALMAGRDALAVLPTGAGKSAIYQVPAPLLPGPTIVVSPLLALQQDQIAALTARNHEDLVAVRLSSAEGKTERAEALESLRKGDAEF